VALLAAELSFEVARTVIVDRHLGVDTIALVAMVGALALNEELAGAVIGLMFSGDAALEAVASRRARPRHGVDCHLRRARVPHSLNRARRPRENDDHGWGALPVVVLIGFSRVYLGEHFPSDVIAGWCVGIAWLAILVLLLWESTPRFAAPRAIEGRSAHPPPASPRRRWARRRS
jgi:hypothetical protein